MADNEFLFLESLLERQHQDLMKVPNPSMAIRKKMLMLLREMLIKHESAFMNALVLDMGKPAFEAFSCEIAVLLNEIDYVVQHLNQWSKPRHSYRLRFGYLEAIQKKRNPYGSVLVISPWNYPLQLALMPAISAIAAGNRCVIKPSEYAPATGKVLKEAIGETFPPEQITVVTGGAETAKRLISLPFDLIFFTGSQQTGKVVAQQAAEHLTPVVLELGGKNPCVIDETGFSTAAIREIVWGKFLNAGQTCIAPDTLFVHTSVYEKSLSEISATILDFYGEHPQNSTDYARVCHHTHFRKVVDFISQGQVWHGGRHDENDLFIAPTVLTDLNMKSPIMKQEIFGPVLPVIPYTDLETLLSQRWISRDALTAYIFSSNNSNIQIFKQYMQSTIVSVNQVIHHAANPQIPFGGIGGSGHGSYHGEAGFQACSHVKTAYRAYHYMNVPDKFPPYSDENMRVIKKFRKWLL